jgi:alanine dehydrogenase
MVTSPYDLVNLPVIEGTSIHCFAVPNIPSLGARTTTEALGDVVLPYLIEIISHGLDAAARKSPVIRTGINIQNGEIIHPGLIRTN